MLKLPCANKLGNCSKNNVTRFHATCLHCRDRRKHFSKWVEPPSWIQYVMPWTVTLRNLVNPKGQVVAQKMYWRTIKIDPRGHFTRVRWASIVALDHLIPRFKLLRKPLVCVMEFLANYPTFQLRKNKNEMLEKLAMLQHERWSATINYIAYGKFSAEDWQRKAQLAQKPYVKLSEAEKNVCRDEARKVLRVLNGKHK